MDTSRSFVRRLYLLEKQVFNVSTQMRLGFSSIEGGYIDGYDDNGNPTVIVGELPDGSTGSIDVGGPNPPRPTGLTFTGGIRSLVFNWAGTFDTELGPPLNFARVEIHVGTSPTFIPDLVGPVGVSSTLKGTIETPRGGGVVIAGFDPPGGDPDAYPDYFACLVARSTSGKYSEPSVIEGPVVPVNITKIELEDFTVTSDDIAALAITAEKVFPGAIVADKVGANAILAVNIQANAVNTAHLQANAVTADILAANSVTAFAMAANSVVAGTIAVNAVTAGTIAADAVTANKIAAGAIDGKLITGATIRTSAGTTRVELSGSVVGAVQFYHSSSLVGQVTANSDGVYVVGPGASIALRVKSTEVETIGDLRVSLGDFYLPTLPTNVGGQPVMMGGFGRLFCNTSPSLRQWKTDINAITVDPDALAGLGAFTWRYREDVPFGVDDFEQLFFGYMYDDADTLGLDVLIDVNNGLQVARPERLPFVLLAAWQADRLANQQRFTELEDQIAALTA